MQRLLRTSSSQLRRSKQRVSILTLVDCAGAGRWPLAVERGRLDKLNALPQCCLSFMYIFHEIISHELLFLPCGRNFGFAASQSLYLDIYIVLQLASLSELEKAGCIMIRSQQRRSHIANWRRTVYDDDPEPVQIQHGIEAVPIPPGLEQIPVEHHRQANAPQVVLGKEGKEVLTEHDHGPSESRPSVRKWFWILVAATVVAVAIAVAVGVGVVVRRRTQAHNNHS